MSTQQLKNLKPYRTKTQKELAKSTAKKRKDGAYHSDAPVSYHKGGIVKQGKGT